MPTGWAERYSRWIEPALTSFWAAFAIGCAGLIVSVAVRCPRRNRLDAIGCEVSHHVFRLIEEMQLLVLVPGAIATLLVMLALPRRTTPRWRVLTALGASFALTVAAWRLQFFF